MLVSRRAIDTDALEWQPLSDVVHYKLLNGNRDEGPHTLMLRSGPREPGPSYAQYHSDDEELFCLQGDFTFDGTTWFSDGSYAFYPAYFVHGTKVHVRGGYELYLRQGGPNQLFKVAEPASDTPYYVGDGQPAANALQLADATSTAGDKGHTDTGPLQVNALHTDPATGKGSTLLTATPNAVGRTIELETLGVLELFVVSGAFALADGARLKERTYHCEVGERPGLALHCTEVGSLLVSHNGELQVRSAPAQELEGQA